MQDPELKNKKLEKQVTGCIVLYKNDIPMLERAIHSFLDSAPALKLFLIDNSPTDDLKKMATDARIEYFHNRNNDGFGKAHNIGIQKAKNLAKYHLVLNPDIYFDKDVLDKMIQVMEADSTTGVIMPKVLYPDNSQQHLVKLLPTPFDFIFRRFIPLPFLKKQLVKNYEMHGYKYDKIIEVPFLSGCFMFCRHDALESVQGFDENIFMYTEDIDLCRRVNDAGYKTIVYPFASVYHDHERKSFMKMKNLQVYMRSAWYYFNKYGWFIDRKRIQINKKALSQLS